MSTPVNPIYDTYLPKSATIVTLEGATNPVRPASSNEDDDSGEHIPWGTNDNDPAVWRKKIEDSSTAYPLIIDWCGMIFGRGVSYYKEKMTPQGIVYEFVDMPEINDFLAENNIDYLMLERLMDFKMTGNTFSQLIKNDVGDKITQIHHMEAEFSRYSKPEGNPKKSKKLYYDGNWDTPNYEQSFPLIYKLDKHLEGMKKPEYKADFALHSCFPSPGHTTYAKPSMFGIVRKDGWLDFANRVPEIMNAINNNAMELKYHIKIPFSYWSGMHPTWDSMKQEDKSKLMSDELDRMDEWLAGAKNAGKSFISHYGTDPITGRKIDGWEITVIDSPGKKDAFLTSLQEADIQITRSLNMDVSMAGIQPAGGKMGAGSGSDKRVGFDNVLASSYGIKQVILEPLIMAHRFNGWDPSIKYGFLNEKPVALNESLSGKTTEV